MNKLTKELIKFIDESPSCFHVVDSVAKRLQGFERLYENHTWSLDAGGKYYVVRDGSSVIAFTVPARAEKIRISAAHSDSPVFKCKPDTPMVIEKYTRLNTEKYGGMNMSTWIDRPLSVAGRVVTCEDGEYKSHLVNIDRDLLLIPSVAIHMKRDVNDGFKYDAQVDTIPLFGDDSAKEKWGKIIAKAAGVEENEILGEDLFVYSRSQASVWGADSEYVSHRALDDLQCVFGTMTGFINAVNELENSSMQDKTLRLFCVFDNEEVGSLTSNGADSTFLADVITRITEALGMSQEEKQIMIAEGMMVSADNAHAVHPNHPEYADPVNRPYMNQGIVIKYNASQKYTTAAVTDAVFRDICKAVKVPVQSYANKSNIAGGSTLGNLSNRHVSIPTIDIGLPQLAMHSAYETAGVKDTEYLVKAMTEFFSR